MPNTAVTDRDLEKLLLDRIPLVDVRAPVEFEHGTLPGSVNLPLLNDEERAAVGTTYKREGQDAAIALGHRFLSGETRANRIQSWTDFARANPSAWVFCFRGGLRSQSVQAALREEGVSLPLIPGGYKRVRQLLLNAIERVSRDDRYVVVSGFTGSAKTDLLEELAGAGARVCDLEAAAHHRGSAFGRLPERQPSQIDFENFVALALLRAEAEASRGETSAIVLEDESRKVGRCEVPRALFDRLSSAPVYVIDRPLPDRARFLTRLYIERNYGLFEGDRPDSSAAAATKFVRFRQDVAASLEGIARRLGGTELKAFLDETSAAHDEHERTGSFAAHHEWVERLLVRYYDPMYAYHLDRLGERVAFRGTYEEVRAKLLDLRRL